MPAAGKEIINLFMRKAGPHAHKLTKRQKTRAEQKRKALVDRHD